MNTTDRQLLLISFYYVYDTTHVKCDFEVFLRANQTPIINTCTTHYVFKILAIKTKTFYLIHGDIISRSSTIIKYTHKKWR